MMPLYLTLEHGNGCLALRLSLRDELHSFRRWNWKMYLHWSVCEIAEWFESVGVGQRALPIRVFTVGKKRSPAVQLLVDEYTSKLRRYCAVEDVQVRSNPRNAREKQAQIVDEDVAVMNLIKPDDWVVLLDEQGIDIESEEMAELIGGAADKGASKLSFCIGGPYGHGPKLRGRANISVKLSSLVLNHQIALVVLMEQLYRSWTILKGQKYHH